MATLTVTVKDHETGDFETRPLPANDYVLICGAERYLAHTQVYANGTHVLTIKPLVREEEPPC